MNKYLKPYIIILILFLSCKTAKQTVDVNQLNTNYPIILYLNQEYKEIVRIKFPIKIKLTNNLISKKSFSSVNYKYHPYEKGIGVPLYIEKDNKLIRVKQSQKKEIVSKEIKEYIIYTRHRIDTSKSMQKNFDTYINEMIVKNQDTLVIGTIDSFKKEYPQLLKLLTYKDSISIDMWQDKDISIPVAW
jgi:uncharacterized protein YqgQ